MKPSTAIKLTQNAKKPTQNENPLKMLDLHQDHIPQHQRDALQEYVVVYNNMAFEGIIVQVPDNKDELPDRFRPHTEVVFDVARALDCHAVLLDASGPWHQGLADYIEEREKKMLRCVTCSGPIPEGNAGAVIYTDGYSLCKACVARGKTVRQTHGMACPQCGLDTCLGVSAIRYLTLTPSDYHVDKDHPDNESIESRRYICGNCGSEGPAHMAEVEPVNQENNRA